MQDNTETAGRTRGIVRRLPRDIWVLGLGSMLMDISSELVHSLLPVLLTTVLGASMLTIGVIEGVAEGTAAMTKVFSGALSDYLKKRKFLVVLGYGLGAISKPVFPLATTIGWVFGARFVDRVGKGIRGAPRDALIADITPAHMRGAAYGLRQALDSLGALLGPLLAVACMAWLADDIRAVMWIGVVPAFLAVLLLMAYVREPGSIADSRRTLLTFADAKRLPRKYRLVVLLGAVCTLARFSEAFLILRARDVGLAVGMVPAVMIAMNIAFAGFAYPFGAAADRIPARTLLLTGLGVLVVADVVLATAASPWMAFLGAGLWGLHMALTQGLFSKLVASTSPVDLRGTAFGIFNLVSGVALLLASVIAGSLWTALGGAATFIAGASFAAIAAVGLLAYRSGMPDQSGPALK